LLNKLNKEVVLGKKVRKQQKIQKFGEIDLFKNLETKKK